MAREAQSPPRASIVQRTATATAGHQRSGFRLDRDSVKRPRIVWPESASTKFHKAFGGTWNTARNKQILHHKPRTGRRPRKNPDSKHPALRLRAHARNGGNHHSRLSLIPPAHLR